MSRSKGSGAIFSPQMGLFLQLNLGRFPARNVQKWMATQKTPLLPFQAVIGCHQGVGTEVWAWKFGSSRISMAEGFRQCVPRHVLATNVGG